MFQKSFRGLISRVGRLIVQRKEVTLEERVKQLVELEVTGLIEDMMEEMTAVESRLRNRLYKCDHIGIEGIETQISQLHRRLNHLSIRERNRVQDLEEKIKAWTYNYNFHHQENPVRWR